MVILRRVTAILFVPLFFAGLAFAAPEEGGINKGGIQITPLTHNFEIMPGQSSSGSITVTNLNQTSISYGTEAEDFRKVSNEGAPSYEGVAKKDGVSSLADWIIVTENGEGELAPGEAVEIKFNIEVPTTAEPGGHYAALFAKQSNEVTSSGGNQVGVVSRVGSIILVSVPGDVKKTASITTFIAPKIVWWGPVPFFMTVENTGTVHYDSVAKVELDPWFGGNKTIEMGTHTIVPKNQRDYEGEWENIIPFGYYKVAASATDGDGKTELVKTSFIAIPLIIVVPLILLILIIYLLVRYFRRNFRRVGSVPPTN